MFGYDRSLYGFVACVLFGLVASGCSRGEQRPAVTPVSGTVTYNGNPVEGAIVSFSSSGGKPAATGVTDASGKYALHTFVEGDGAAPGDYIVTLSKTSVDDPLKGKTTDEISEMHASGKPVPQAVVKHLLPQKYSTVQDSPEKASVKAGEPNVIDFKLAD
jgi:hypothetical protein